MLASLGRLISSRPFEGSKIGQLDAEDEKTMIPQNAGNYIANDIA